jgi:hypothetical protein
MVLKRITVVNWRTFVSILGRRFWYRRIGGGWAGAVGAIHENTALPLANFPLKGGDKQSRETGCQEPRQDEVKRLRFFRCKFGLNLDQVFFQ